MVNDGGSLAFASDGTANNAIWKIAYTGEGLTFASALSAKLFVTVPGGVAEEGAALSLADAAKSPASLFRAAITHVIDDGCYVITNAYDKVLAVSSASFFSGANVKQKTADGTLAQTFYIKNVDGYVQITNSKSFKAVDVSGGSTAEGANIQQYTPNGTAAQLWVVSVDDRGGLVFATSNDATMVLSAEGDSNESGANVALSKFAGLQSQSWSLSTAENYSISGDVELDEIISKCWDKIGQHSDMLSNAFYYVAYQYKYMGQSRYPDGVMPEGDFSIGFAKEMYKNGKGNCYRFASLFCWLAKSIGYDARVANGWVTNRYGNHVDHGWVEIKWKGQKIVCDPEMQYDYPSYNWYWQTYDTSPTEYHFFT